MPSNWIIPIDARWPRILSEQLVPIGEPLEVVLDPGKESSPQEVADAAARALLDGGQMEAPEAWPAWLAPHQIPAARRLSGILGRYGGALLADAVGLGKSYVALAVALSRGEPFMLVVPAVLVPQWRSLLTRFGQHDAPIVTHESLSKHPYRPLPSLTVPYRLFIVDEAHRFRNPETNRYRALARLMVGSHVLLVSATPVHNSIADVVHLFRLFLRDHVFTALGIPSLRHAAIPAAGASLISAAIARLVVARSRLRVQRGYRVGPVTLAFPPLAAQESIRAGTANSEVLAELVSNIGQLRAGGAAAPLLRLILLRRLGSSIAAFRATLLRHEAYLDLAARAAAEGRALSPREFQICFPRAAESDIQLVLFPLLLDAGTTADSAGDRTVLAKMRAMLAPLPRHDPKAEALERFLAGRRGKTIVFSDAQPTVRYLMQRLRGRRAAAVFGTAGHFAAGAAHRREVLKAFAPVAQGAAAVAPALATDVLIATDLLSEGLNLQDADCVVHYDLPWSPARLTQRVGRIDRLGSGHPAITTVTFAPPEPLASALALEQRLAAKVQTQVLAGAEGQLDWCDELAEMSAKQPGGARRAVCAAIVGERDVSLLIVRIGACVDAIVVEGKVARASPAAATRLLANTMTAEPATLDRIALQRAIAAAIPLIKARIGAVQDARWRASDRDRFARRLIPWALSAARRAARRGNADQLRGLDGLVSRLALGMTAGEELLLEDLLAQKEPLTVRDMLAWHERLPPPESEESGTTVELVAALVHRPP
jgi:hypothetical protein